MSHRDARKGKNSLVVYNRSKRAWEILDYHDDRVIATFPRGPEGKCRALERQVGLAERVVKPIEQGVFFCTPLLLLAKTLRLGPSNLMSFWGDLYRF